MSSVETFSGAAAVAGSGFINTLSMVSIISILVISFIVLIVQIRRFMLFDHAVTVFTKTKSGILQKRWKGGWIKNPKTNNLEFQIMKPKHIINNFNRSWVFPSLKRMFGKSEVYLWQLKDNKYEQLNANFVTSANPGTELAFVPRQIGKDRFEDYFDKETKELYGIGGWFWENKEKIFWGGMMFMQAAMIILLINYGNKILA